ncbi:MAG: hypothetical protein ACK4VK_00765 [Aquificaceae bacterium]
MKVLLMEKNLLLLSRIRASLSQYSLRVGEDYKGEEVVLVNIEQYSPEIIKTLKEKGAKVIAYCGHKNVSLIESAKGFGADKVVPNSQIVNVKELLRDLG